MRSDIDVHADCHSLPLHRTFHIPMHFAVPHRNPEDVARYRDARAKALMISVRTASMTQIDIFNAESNNIDIEL
jgi:hypothetical protein